jgi:hypothetical protein
MTIDKLCNLSFITLLKGDLFGYSRVNETQMRTFLIQIRLLNGDAELLDFFSRFFWIGLER